MTGIERREFVKGAAGVAVGLAGMPALLRGQDDRMVRVGLIGIGDRGTGLLDLMLRRPDTMVKAICDVDPEAIARTFRAPRWMAGASGAVLRTEPSPK